MTLARKSLKRFAWLAMALFLCGQLLVSQHTAEFGSEKHTHHGTPCQIQLFADHFGASSLPSIPALPIVVLLVLAILLVQQTSTTSRDYRVSAPRAPPLSIA